MDALQCATGGIAKDPFERIVALALREGQETEFCQYTYGILDTEFQRLFGGFAGQHAPGQAKSAQEEHPEMTSRDSNGSAAKGPCGNNRNFTSNESGHAVPLGKNSLMEAKGGSWWCAVILPNHGLLVLEW